MDLIYQRYLNLKQFLLTEDYTKLINYPSEVSIINQKIYITDIENLSGKINTLNPDSVLSLVNFITDNPKFQHKVIKLKDVPVLKENLPFKDYVLDSMKILDKLNESYSFIMENKSILIHCKKGMSRSAFVYLYYKLKKHYTLQNREKRPILLFLLGILKAKRGQVIMGDLFLMYLCVYEYHFIEFKEKI